MASTSELCFHTIFRFTVDAINLTTNSIESSEVQLSNVNWKVKLEKVSIEDDDNNKDVLGVYLVSQFGDNINNWSCQGQATFKLLPKDADKMDQSIVKYLPKRKFSNDDPSHGFDKFVDWNDFLEHFVNKNKAIFEVEISTEPSIRTIALDVDRKYAKFRVVIENVDKLRSCCSSGTVLRGIKWRILSAKDGDNFSLYLYGDKENMDINWLYEVDVSFQLLSFDEKVEPVKYSFTCKFHCGASNRGYKKFLTWSDFTHTDKKYVQDNTAIIVVELKVNEPEPQWQIDDYKVSKENSLLLCTICLECFTSGNIFSIKCGHLFCKPCFDKAIEQRQACPKCNAPTSANDVHPIYFA